MRYIKSFFVFSYRHKRRIFKLSFSALLVGLFFIAGIFIYYSKDLPSPDSISNLYIPESTKIFDRTGTVVLYDIYQEQKRTVITYEDVPDYMRSATIVAEDDNFYHHIGIDVRAVGRAFLANIRGGGIRQGGSTITQQFIKNALLSPERTVGRKVKELILSLELEWKYSKDEIVTLYLNQVPYGSNAYGVEAASRTYFNKPAVDLTVAEAALLAALPNAPSYYSPYGNNTDKLFIRQKYILERMLAFGYITQEQYDEATGQELVFQTTNTGIQAPHFVMYVREVLEEKYGSSFVQQAGLRVITTLDVTLQEAAEFSVVERAPFNKTNFGANNAALVALDPHTGQVLAMVGSRDYFDLENDGNVNVTLRPRQPGSSFKPFAYAVALQKGYTPNTVVYDVPTEFNQYCSWEGKEEKDRFGLDCYHPQNYDSKFVGPISLKEALAQSRNVPAVKTLYLAGLKDTLEFAKKLGIASLGDSSRYGLSLVLGGGEVTLLEETSAYGVFATEGELNKPSIILRIEDKDGNTVEEYRKKTQRVMDKNTANLITYMLSENSFRAPVFGEQNSLTIKNLALAAKTGTTQEYRDAWTVGYTPSMAVGVWVGNNNNAAMRKAPGASAAAPIWNAFIREAYSKKTGDAEELRGGLFYFPLPTITNEIAFTPPTLPEEGRGVLGGVIGPHSILHYISTVNPLGSPPKNPLSDPQYRNWESAVLGWLNSSSDFLINTSENNTNEDGSSIKISFISPTKHTFKAEASVFLEPYIETTSYIKLVRVFIDDKQINQLTPPATNSHYFSFTQNVSLKNLAEKNFHEIIVEVEDVNQKVKREAFVFTVE